MLLGELHLLILKLLIKLLLLLLKLLLQVEIVLLQLEVLLKLEVNRVGRPRMHGARGFVFGQGLIIGEELLAVIARRPVETALIALEVGAEGIDVHAIIIVLQLIRSIHVQVVGEGESREVDAKG